MTYYDALVKALREHADKMCITFKGAHACGHNLVLEAADAIEELSRAAEVNAKRALKWAADAEKAEEKFRWIPVTERLPEKYQSVWTYSKFGIVQDEYIGELDGKICFARLTTHVTHWMPLPEPPKEE